MRTKHFIQSLVGTAKIIVKEISIEPETNAVIIAVRPMKRSGAGVAFAIRSPNSTTKDEEFAAGGVAILDQVRHISNQKLHVLFARNTVLLPLLSHGRDMAHGAANALRTPLYGLPFIRPKLSFQSLCESSGIR